MAVCVISIVSMRSWTLGNNARKEELFMNTIEEKNDSENLERKPVRCRCHKVGHLSGQCEAKRHWRSIQIRSWYVSPWTPVRSHLSTMPPEYLLDGSKGPYSLLLSDVPSAGDVFRWSMKMYIPDDDGRIGAVEKTEHFVVIDRFRVTDPSFVDVPVCWRSWKKSLNHCLDLCSDCPEEIHTFVKVISCENGGVGYVPVIWFLRDTEKVIDYSEVFGVAA